MSWYPLDSSYSTENFLSSETGAYQFTNFSGQNHIGGIVSLRNIATGNQVVVSPGEPWPPLGWDQSTDFDNLWGAYTGTYVLSGNTPTANTAYNTISLVGATRILQERNSNYTADQQYFGTHVGLETGLVIEGAFLISRLTGSTESINNQYGIMIQDDPYAEVIKLQLSPTPGFVIGTGQHYETFVPATGIGAQVIPFRFAMRGVPPLSTGHFVTAEGFSAIITGVGANTRSMTNSGVTIGDLSSIIGGTQEDSTSQIEVGRFRQKHGVLDIDGDFISDTEYSVTPLTLYTEAFTPPYAIENWEKMYVKLVGRTGGTVSITPQIKNSQYTSFTNIIADSFTKRPNEIGGMFGIDISTGLSTRGDMSDQIRFQITQESEDGSAPSLSVDYITVTYSPAGSDGLVNLYPNNGSSDQDTIVTISIDDKNFVRAQHPTDNETTEFLLDFRDGEVVYDNDINKYVFNDLSSNFTGTTSVGTTGDLSSFSGRFQRGTKNFRTAYIRDDISIDQIFTLSGSTEIYNRPVNGGHLLTSPNYSVTVPSSTGGGISNLTGLPTVVGETLESYSTPARATLNPVTIGNYITETISFTDNSGYIVSMPAQTYNGIDGFGFKTPFNTDANNPVNYVAVEAIISVEKGALGIAITGASGPTVDQNNSVTYSSHQYGIAQRVRSVFPYRDDLAVHFFGAKESGLDSDNQTEECRFTVAGVRVLNYENDPVTYSEDNATLTGLTSEVPALAVDAWVKLDGNVVSTIDDFTGNVIQTEHSNGLFWGDLGVDRNGYPIFRVEQDFLTGHSALNANEWHHILGQISHASSYKRMEIFLDGEIVGYKPHNVALANDFGEGTVTVKVGQGFIGAIEAPRVRTQFTPVTSPAINDAYKVAPKFQSELQFYSGAPMLSLWRLDEGSLNDCCTGEHHLIIPDTGEAKYWTERNTEGVFGECVGFIGPGGRAHTLDNVNLERDAQHSIGGYIAAVQNNGNPTIYRHGETVLKLQEGRLHYTLTGNTTFTGNTRVDQKFAWSWFKIDHHAEGDKLFVTGYYSTGLNFNPEVAFSGYGQEGTLGDHQFMIGKDINSPTEYGDIYLDEIFISTGLYPTGSMSFRVQKQKPDEIVFAGGAQISTGQTYHIGVYDKTFVMPPRSSWDRTGASVQVEIEAKQGYYSVYPAYRYVGARAITATPDSIARLEDISENICKTKSPFRVGAVAPDGTVNLAFITSPPFSIENNLSLISAKDSNSENFAPSFSNYRAMSESNNTTGSSVDHQILYTKELDTDEVLVTNLSMIRENQGIAAPLFYKYRLGQDKFFLFQEGAQDKIDEDFLLIRNSISIVDDKDNELSIDDFPWDIRISKYRDEGVSLPSKVYNVEILSRDKYIPRKSLFIKYNAANPYLNYAQVLGHTEILNPQPIFRQVKNGETQETFFANDVISFPVLPGNSGGANYNQGPDIYINNLTGDWQPWQHDDLINEDDFII